MAIDANIELSEEDGVFDVYGYLVKMRQQRRGLVETLVSTDTFLFYSFFVPSSAIFYFALSSRLPGTALCFWQLIYSGSSQFFLPQNQYKFVFETLLEYTRGIDSRFPVSELANKIKERGVKDKKTKKNVYQMEYEVR